MRNDKIKLRVKMCNLMLTAMKMWWCKMIGAKVTKCKDLNAEEKERCEIFRFYCYIPWTQFIALHSGKTETQRAIFRP